MARRCCFRSHSLKCMLMWSHPHSNIIFQLKRERVRPKCRGSALPVSSAWWPARNARRFLPLISHHWPADNQQQGKKALKYWKKCLWKNHVYISTMPEISSRVYYLNFASLVLHWSCKGNRANKWWKVIPLKLHHANCLPVLWHILYKLWRSMKWPNITFVISAPMVKTVHKYKVSIRYTGTHLKMSTCCYYCFRHVVCLCWSVFQPFASHSLQIQSQKLSWPTRIITDSIV